MRLCGRRRVTGVNALRASFRTNPLIFDTLLAFSLMALGLVTLLAGARDVGSYDPLSVALFLLQPLPLVLRRVFPIAVLVVTLAMTLVHAFFAVEDLSSGLPVLIALFTVSESHPRRISAPIALAVAASFFTLIAVRGGIPIALGSVVQTELAVLAAWTLGTWARERQAHLDIVEERARLADETREADARRAVAEERDRIAREMHDVVTHHVSVIVIQAGAAERALDRRPEDARQAISAIAATGRQALADMRTMLGILGPGDQVGSGADEAPEPMPGLDRLGELIESVRAAGLPVELAISGERRPLDPGIELSAYRIIQEALTNTLKHANGARSRVSVRYGPSDLELSVADEGGTGSRDLAAEGGGRGLIGMRERVAMFGGEFEAGPMPTGFRVLARLPVAAASAP
jgi:signal transduction histidine kinase